MKLSFTNGDPPAQLILTMLNNVPQATIQAELEKKGMIMFEPKVVIGTTNVKGLMAASQSHEPASIIRRWEYVITVEVKDEFRKDGQHVLDPMKVPEGTIKDLWNFRVEAVHTRGR
eukprot:848823_1